MPVCESFLLYPLSLDCISFMGGQELTHPNRRWSLGQILLLLLGVSLVIWGIVAKMAFILVRLLH